VLLKALGEPSGRPPMAVRLLAFALDRETALAKVLEGVERSRTGPLEAERIVLEALKLGPGPLQEARLWEFQADAWGWASTADGLSISGPPDCSCCERALEALERALRTLGEGEAEVAARLQRKRALLELRLRRLEPAEASIRRAAALLADHPFHPEQPRLRLALGRLELRRGALGPAVAALRSGLERLSQKEAGHRDQVELLLELGRAQGEGAQFQDALATLETARRLAEQDGDPRAQAEVLDALGQVRLGLGQIETAWRCLREAIQGARSLDDPALVAECHLDLGILLSGRQLLGPALASLESAIRRFELLGDRPRAGQAQAWKARNLAALGDPGLAELLLLRVAGAGTGLLTPAELGERVFLEAEIAGFQDDWVSARRHYQAAGNRFHHAGLVLRDRLARLRCIQAEARSGAILEPAWTRLEQLQRPVADCGSRWLELEWRRAHALLLAASGPALAAWGEVLAGARELGFPAVALEAGTRCAEILLDQGEGLAARARIEDALPSAQDLWANLPEGFGPPFLGRNDLHRFRRAAQTVGMNIQWPERVDPPPDRYPATADLSLARMPWTSIEFS
jgi:tetratricopeptide (TPR) repeat protein